MHYNIVLLSTAALDLHSKHFFLLPEMVSVIIVSYIDAQLWPATLGLESLHHFRGLSNSEGLDLGCLSST